MNIQKFIHVPILKKQDLVRYGISQTIYIHPYLLRLIPEKKTAKN